MTVICLPNTWFAEKLFDSQMVYICRYQGPNLLDAIDSIQPPRRDVSKPVIMPVCDVVKSQSMGQISAIGKLEAGALRNGSKVQFVVQCSCS